METVVKVILVIAIAIVCIALSAVVYYGLAYILLWAVSQFIAIEITKKTTIAVAVVLWVLFLIFGSKKVVVKQD